MNEEVFSVFICFHTDSMNKYIFLVQQKISGNFRKISWKFSVTYFSGKATSLTWFRLES